MADASRIVSATGAAVGYLGGNPDAKRIEGAMIKAIEAAHARGITDPEEIRKLIRAARDEAVGG